MSVAALPSYTMLGRMSSNLGTLSRQASGAQGGKEAAAVRQSAADGRVVLVVQIVRRRLFDAQPVGVPRELA